MLIVYMIISGVIAFFLGILGEFGNSLLLGLILGVLLGIFHQLYKIHEQLSTKK